MIKISERAAERIFQLKQQEKQDDVAMLRVKVKRGGCSGWSYKMDFATDADDKDKIFESHGQKIVVDSQSLLYLMGMTLDFDGGLNGQGFLFSNPNATKTCGCGSSFAV